MMSKIGNGNSSEKKIPEFLSHLPVYRGYPIPYFVPKDKDGVYQLKYADGPKMDNCLKYHKCCICFKPLTKGQYFFISGPIGLETQTDSHPPMHKKCAEYSLEMCPHLFYEKTHRTTNEETSTEWQIRSKPKEFYLVHAKNISPIKPDGIHLVVKYSSILSKEKFIYENGLLIRDSSRVGVTPKEQEVEKE